jgi:hypothetical protein
MTVAHAEPRPETKPQGPGGSCPHGYISSGSFCAPSQGAQDAIPNRATALARGAGLRRARSACAAAAGAKRGRNDRESLRHLQPVLQTSLCPRIGQTDGPRQNPRWQKPGVLSCSKGHSVLRRYYFGVELIFRNSASVPIPSGTQFYAGHNSVAKRRDMVPMAHSRGEKP